MKTKKKIIDNCKMCNLRSSYKTEKVSSSTVVSLSIKLIENRCHIEGEVCSICGKAMYKNNNYKCNCN